MGHAIYSFDPNGIPIEFCYEVEGHDMRKDPVLRDDSPPTSALEGEEPQPGKWPEVTHPTPLGKRRII
jgi:hypothetical protein